VARRAPRAGWHNVFPIAPGRADPAFYEGFPNVKESAVFFAFRYMNFRRRCGDPVVILK